LLVFISSVELAYTPLEPSISVSVLLGVMTLLVGLAIAYLTLADGGALAETELKRIRLPKRRRRQRNAAATE
jgi:hypothetical protein